MRDWSCGNAGLFTITRIKWSFQVRPEASFAEFLAADAALGPEIEKTIHSLESLHATRPEFFTRCDYDFAVDRSLYRAAREPSFRLRLLEALTELHAFFTAQGAEVPDTSPALW